MQLRVVWSESEGALQDAARLLALVLCHERYGEGAQNLRLIGIELQRTAEHCLGFRSPATPVEEVAEVAVGGGEVGICGDGVAISRLRFVGLARSSQGSAEI